MAIWQFDLHLIPKAKVIELFQVIPDEIDNNVFDSIDWWVNCQPPTNLTDFIGQFLVQGASWSKDMRTWGKADSNRIDIYYEADEVESISVRLDLREWKKDFVKSLLEFASCNNMLLIIGKLKIVDLTYDNLVDGNKTV